MATQVTIATGLLVTPNPVAADATGNYVIPAAGSGGVAIRIINGSGASITATLDDVNSVSPPNAQSFNADVQQAIPAGAVRTFRIKDMSRFLDQNTGRISWSYTAAGSVTVEALEL